MKATNDRTMDVLLRRQAQRNTPLSESGDARGELGGHLDADELNAFAENALPEAARARYMSHLADCDSCRKLATELTMTASATMLTNREFAPRKSLLSSFRQMIAPLFSLPALRYGVPALTIFILAIVAFVALRDRGGAEFVAQNESAGKVARPDDFTGASSSGQSNLDAAPQQKQIAGQTSASGPAAKDVAKEAPQEKVRSSSNAAPPGYAGGANTVQPGFAPEPNAVPNERDDKFKNAQVAAAPAKPAPSDNVKLADQVRVEQPAGENRNTVTMQKEEQVSRQNRDSGPAPPPKSGVFANESKASKGGPQRAREQSERTREQSESDARSAGSVGARTVVVPVERKVSGRTFRRQGDAWVDTAYRSSLTLTPLARGSRLFDDEPGLRAIAGQLGGNVIVVWKGKAYRIH